MATILLTSRIDKPEALELARKILTSHKLRESVKKFIVDSSLKPYLKLLSEKIVYKSIEEFPKVGANLVVVIGGDGSILRLLHYFKNKNPPHVFSINLGRYGFLSEISPENAINLLRDIVENRGTYEIVFKPRIIAYTETGQLPPVLNDYVVLAPRLKMVHLKLIKARTKELVYNIYADGIIISPTAGSTGYSLSVGGPIVDEDLLAIITTPMNPMQLRARPVIFDINEELVLEIIDRDVEVFADGFLCCKISEGGSLRIKFWDKVGFYRKERQYYNKLTRRDHV